MKRLIIIVAMVLIVSSTASAAMVYTNRATWQTAVGSWTLENFDDGVLDPGVSFVSTNTTDGVGIQAGGGVLGGDNVFWDRLVIPGWSGYPAAGTTTTWSFAAPIYGFGADWDLAGPGGPGTSIRMYLNGALVGSEIVNTTAGTFWGVTNGAFNSVLLTYGTSGGAWAETYEMDDMVYTYVPLPGAILLGILGLSAAGIKLRKFA